MYEKLNYVINDLDYRDNNRKAVPITKIFPQVACLILPGRTQKNNFVGEILPYLPRLGS